MLRQRPFCWQGSKSSPASRGQRSARGDISFNLLGIEFMYSLFANGNTYGSYITHISSAIIYGWNIADKRFKFFIFFTRVTSLRVLFFLVWINDSTSVKFRLRNCALRFKLIKSCLYFYYRFVGIQPAQLSESIFEISFIMYLNKNYSNFTYNGFFLFQYFITPLFHTVFKVLTTEYYF